MKIELEINEEDRMLYHFLKQFEKEGTMKEMLSNAVELFSSSCSIDGEQGFFSPEVLKERKLKNLSKQELLKLREQYLADMLDYAQDYHPDQNECGVIKGSDNVFWFVDEGANLGYITIYANYIKAIDEMLNK